MWKVYGNDWRQLYYRYVIKQPSQIYIRIQAEIAKHSARRGNIEKDT